jgi:hypothetical protein
VAALRPLNALAFTVGGADADMITTAHTPTSVKPTLTPRRRHHPAVEKRDYAAFSRRVIRAAARRIAAGDVDELTHLFSLERELQRAIHIAVNGLRAQGYSWADIALRIGITRQAAHQRWATTDET